MKQDLADIPEEDVLRAIPSLGQQGVNVLRITAVAPGKKAQQQNVSPGLPDVCRLHNRRNPGGDFLRGVEADIVCSDLDENDLGIDAVQFAMLDAPQDIFCPVLAKPEVGHREPGKALGP